MAKFLVLGGAGAEGSVLARDLVNSGIEEVVLADYNLEGAKEVADELNKLGKSKVSAIKADANKHDELVQLMKEQNPDVVCNLIDPFYRFGVPVVKATIEAGFPYVDINDDFQPSVEVLDTLDDKAKEAGIPVFIGCGVSPGWTNIVSKLGSTKLDQTDKITMKWLWPALAGGGVGVIQHFYHILSGDCIQFLDGEYKKVPAGSNKTKVTSSDGKYDGFAHFVGHGEPATVPRYIEGVKEVTNYGGLLPIDADDLYFAFMDAGLDDIEPLEVNGQMISLTDVTIALMTRKYQDSEEAKDENGYFSVRVEGKKDGKDKAYLYELAANGAHMTTWTASAIAQLIAKGEIKITGTNTPECLDAEQIEVVLKELENRGLNTKVTEY